VGDRFRLIYLKSTDLEKPKADEPPSFHEQEETSKDASPSNGFSVQEALSTQTIMKQASADLEHPDPKVRILAIRYLEQSDASIALPLLQEVLFDKDPEVRIQALSSLIKFRNLNIFPLLKKSLKDKEPGVRLLALRGMFQTGEKIDLNILLQFLSDESPWVRRKLATLLGWSQTEGVFPILMELCKDTESGVRRAALISLITLYPEESENRLVEAMTDSDPDIRKWARKTLERMTARPMTGSKGSLSHWG
jgi:HEAT repeat protein